MSSSETLFKAAFNRLRIRLEKIINSSETETSSFVKDAPNLVKKKWNEFKEEIILEAERLENEEAKNASKKDNSLETENFMSQQSHIDQIREKVASLSNYFEELH